LLSLRISQKLSQDFEVNKKCPNIAVKSSIRA
jgi:hypothetical protein